MSKHPLPLMRHLSQQVGQYTSTETYKASYFRVVIGHIVIKLGSINVEVLQELIKNNIDILIVSGIKIDDILDMAYIPSKIV